MTPAETSFQFHRGRTRTEHEHEI